jgi:hypothetical protein
VLPRPLPCGSMAGNPPQKPGMRTVIGLAPAPRPIAAPSPPQAPPPSSSSAIEAPPPSVSAGRVINISGAGPVAPKNIPGTMVGIVSPVPPAPSAKSSNAQRTMMGVARPGIAPTHERPPEPPSSLRAAPPFVAPPPPPVIVDAPIEQGGGMRTLPMPDEPGELHGERVTLPGVRPRKSSLLPVFVIASIAAAIAIAIIAFMMRARPAPAVSAEVRGEGEARSLVVKCATCSDGSSLVHGDAKATFDGGKAKLSLRKEDVALGTNRIAVSIVDGKQQWPMTLEVVVPFLVRVDLSRLDDGAEAFDLVFSVVPEVTAIEIEGKETKPQGGKATIAMPIPAATKDDDRAFASTIAFGVKLGSEVRAGALEVSLPRAALKLGLPGRNGVLLSPTGGAIDVSGRTTPNAKVRLGSDADAIVVADENGVFRGRAKPEADDATSVTLQAFGEGLAPRRLVVPFTRAVSLTNALETFRAKATTPFATIATKPEDHLGEWVDVKLVVAQTGEEDGRTIAVGDVQCKVVEGGRCPGVRVLLPASSILPKPQNGAVIEVVGVVVRSFPIEKGKSTGTEIDATIAAETK